MKTEMIQKLWFRYLSDLVKVCTMKIENHEANFNPEINSSDPVKVCTMKT